LKRVQIGTYLDTPFCRWHFFPAFSRSGLFRPEGVELRILILLMGLKSPFSRRGACGLNENEEKHDLA
jgi:hypothetical protein